MKPLFFLTVLAASAFAQSTTVLPLLPTTVSTVPSNGDVNPYGVVFVPRIPAGTGLQPGDVLVSNFNNIENLQGTGHSIIRINAQNQPSLFFDSASAGRLGLTAALGILANGTVIVGNLATADGTAATVQSGALTFIDRNGHLIGSTAISQVSGPWGMAIHDLNNGNAQVFISNVLNGTVTRLDLNYSFVSTAITIDRATVIGTGFNHRTDPAALVLGPSGLAYDATHDLLYVASSYDNVVYALAGAGAATGSLGPGTAIYNDQVHLHGPLMLAFSPTGHLLVANSDGSNVDPNQPSELVEFTTGGAFVAQSPIDPNNGGAFGLAITTIGWGTIKVAYVDDNANTLTFVTTVVL